MNRCTLPWGKSYKISVLPKTGIYHWFHTSKSVFLYAQGHFVKSEFTQAHFFICEITTVMVGNFETIPCVRVTKEKRI